MKSKTEVIVIHAGFVFNAYVIPTPNTPHSLNLSILIKCYKTD